MPYKIKILIRIDDKDVEHGYLLKQMPQGDNTALYEAIGIETKNFYTLKENEFVDLGWEEENFPSSFIDNHLDSDYT